MFLGNGQNQIYIFGSTTYLRSRAQFWCGGMTKYDNDRGGMTDLDFLVKFKQDTHIKEENTKIPLSLDK